MAQPFNFGERTTLHSLLEASQHRFYYCAISSTSFPVSRMKLTNILPIKPHYCFTKQKLLNVRWVKGKCERRESINSSSPYTIFLAEGLPLLP